MYNPLYEPATGSTHPRLTQHTVITGNINLPTTTDTSFLRLRPSSCTHLRLNYNSYHCYHSSWRPYSAIRTLHTIVNTTNKLSPVIIVTSPLFLHCVLAVLIHTFNHKTHLRGRRAYRLRNRQKMVHDASLLNTQYYKVRINGKVEQSRERSSALPYTSV